MEFKRNYTCVLRVCVNKYTAGNADRVTTGKKMKRFILVFNGKPLDTDPVRGYRGSNSRQRGAGRYLLRLCCGRSGLYKIYKGTRETITRGGVSCRRRPYSGRPSEGSGGLIKI